MKVARWTQSYGKGGGGKGRPQAQGQTPSAHCRGPVLTAARKS